MVVGWFVGRGDAEGEEAKTGKRLGQTGERKNKLQKLRGAKLCGEILLRFAVSGGSISPRHSQDSSWMHIFLLLLH